MKLLSTLAVAGLLFTGVAQADVDPNFEMPISEADLTEIIGTKPVEGARAYYMTKNQRVNADEPTSFTMHEDTGIRCVTTPCPSVRRVQFRITNIEHSFHNADVVRYEAVEVLKNIPPHVRIARRQLFVTESSMELVAPGGGGFTRRTMWQVQVKMHPNNSIMYYAQPTEFDSAEND